MGLFGKLFEKKVCDICGGDIGLLGNRKLEDGNMCKECAAKLSPWFSDRKEATVEEIRGQLAYREENRAAVNAFQITRTFGRYTKVYIDDNQGLFMVSSASNVRNANPDVLSLSQISGCQFDIQDSCMEQNHLVKGEDGKSRYEKFDPPHFKYSYNFRITINVNHPYFDHMSFQINSGSVTIETIGTIEQCMQQPVMEAPQAPGMNVQPGMGRPGMGNPSGPQGRPGMNAQQPGMGRPGMSNPGGPQMGGPQGRPGMNAQPGMGRPGMGNPGMAPRPQAPMPPQEPQERDPRLLNEEYVEYLNMGNDIVAVLTGTAQ